MENAPSGDLDSLIKQVLKLQSQGQVKGKCLSENIVKVMFTQIINVYEYL